LPIVYVRIGTSLASSRCPIRSRFGGTAATPGASRASYLLKLAKGRTPDFDRARRPGDEMALRVEGVVNGGMHAISRSATRLSRRR
jgi:hypothetical protein